MARDVIYLLTALLCLALLAGCAAYAVSPVTGFVYSEVKGPGSATSNSGYSKVGTATAESFLGFVAMGDASISAAMEDGGITKIHHVDYESKNILGIYATFTVIVYGE